MPTIGRRHVGGRDSQAPCDICGVNWLLSELRENAEGHWECPDDRGGRTGRELDDIRALAALEVNPSSAPRKGGGRDVSSTLAGWAWFQGGTAERLGGTLSAQTGGAGIYILGGGGITTAAAMSFDMGDPVRSIPRLYWSSLTGGFLKIRGTNRLGGADTVHSPNSTHGGVLVLAYRDGAGEGVLTEVAWAWVNGSTGAKYDSGGQLAVTTARTATGLYTATLDTGVFTVAEVTRFTSGDVASDSIRHVWGGKTSTTQVKVRALDSGGTEADADFQVRFWQ